VSVPAIVARFGERGIDVFQHGTGDTSSQADLDGIVLADAVVDAGGTADDLEAVLQSCAWDGWRSLRHGARRRRAERWHREARKWVANNPATGGRRRPARAVVLALAGTADGRDWGRARSTMRVYDALLRLAWERYRLAGITADERTLAELAGVDHATVRRAVPRLVADGLLGVVRPTTRGRASEWTLKVPGGLVADERADLSGDWSSLGRVDWTTDLYRWAGIGTDGARVDHALGPTAESAVVVADRLGLTVERTERILVELHDLGRASRSFDGWTRGATLLELAARHCGPAVHGAGERQRLRHRFEQGEYVEFRRWLAGAPPTRGKRGMELRVVERWGRRADRRARPPDLAA
jgi:hypothetical protein